MNKISLLFLALFIVNLSAEEKEVEYEEDIQIAPLECLQLQGSNRGFGSSHQLRFYNSCPTSIYASICVEERPGKFKLHDSASKVPKFGYLTIYTHEGREPSSVEWRSSTGRPEAPGHCGLN